MDTNINISLYEIIESQKNELNKKGILKSFSEEDLLDHQEISDLEDSEIPLEIKEILRVEFKGLMKIIILILMKRRRKKAIGKQVINSNKIGNQR